MDYWLFFLFFQFLFLVLDCCILSYIFYLLVNHIVPCLHGLHRLLLALKSIVKKLKERSIIELNRAIIANASIFILFSRIFGATLLTRELRAISAGELTFPEDLSLKLRQAQMALFGIFFRGALPLN